MIHTVTQSGRIVDLENPNPASITIRDIAAHLAKINRFAGATQIPYSVAQHSLLVASLLADWAGERAALPGLLHDAHEAYLGDIPSPAKAVLDTNLAPFEALDAAICEALDIPAPNSFHRELIKKADRTAFALEWRDLMQGPPPEGTLPCPEGHHPIRPLPWPKAEELFLKTFDKLCIISGLGRTGVPQ